MNTPPPPDDTSRREAGLDALFAAVRAEKPDTARAEYGFETRLLARLVAERSEAAGWREFTAWCWRLVPALAVVTMAFGFWASRPGRADSVDPLSAAVQPLSSDDEDFTQWFAVDLLSPI